LVRIKEFKLTDIIYDINLADKTGKKTYLGRSYTQDHTKASSLNATAKQFVASLYLNSTKLITDKKKVDAAVKKIDSNGVKKATSAGKSVKKK